MYALIVCIVNNLTTNIQFNIKNYEKRLHLHLGSHDHHKNNNIGPVPLFHTRNFQEFFSRKFGGYAHMTYYNLKSRKVYQTGVVCLYAGFRV